MSHLVRHTVKLFMIDYHVLSSMYTTSINMYSHRFILVLYGVNLKWEWGTTSDALCMSWSRYVDAATLLSGFYYGVIEYDWCNGWWGFLSARTERRLRSSFIAWWDCLGYGTNMEVMTSGIWLDMRVILIIACSSVWVMLCHFGWGRCFSAGEDIAEHCGEWLYNAPVPLCRICSRARMNGPFELIRESFLVIPVHS